ncbi:MAG: hypothetical protein JNJ41_13405 [Bacteroidia bacterium]|nr:hypothetical protein [Bacteroidia bacterium]
MKKIVFLSMLILTEFVLAAQTKKGKPESVAKMSYEKHIQLSKIEIPGYKNSYSKLIDTTKKSKESYVIFTRNEKLSNNFETDVVVSYGESKPIYTYKGNLKNYIKQPTGGILRGPKESTQPNTKDSSWVITIGDKKVIMNYYYCYFVNESGETRAKSTILAHYDDGVNNIEARIRPKDFISKENGLTKIKVEQEFKNKLPQVSELESEVKKLIEVYLSNY